MPPRALPHTYCAAPLWAVSGDAPASPQGHHPRRIPDRLLNVYRKSLRGRRADMATRGYMEARLDERED